jgi:hypothetical protein
VSWGRSIFESVILSEAKDPSAVEISRAAAEAFPQALHRPAPGMLSGSASVSARDIPPRSFCNSLPHPAGLPATMLLVSHFIFD